MYLRNNNVMMFIIMYYKLKKKTPEYFKQLNFKPESLNFKQ